MSTPCQWTARVWLEFRAGCCVRTVQRALQQAQRLGLVSWTERRVRAAWRWLRTSNSYRLDVPAEAVRTGLRPAWPCRATSGQNDRGGENQRKQEADKSRKAVLAEFMRGAAALPDLLAARRQVIEARLLAGWRG